MMRLYFVLLFFWQDCLVKGTSKTSTVNQDSGLKRAKVGDSVTLLCSCADDKMTLFTWYQQKLGGKPEVISQWLKGIQQPIVEQAFQQRFHIFQTEDKKETNNLKISNLQVDDTASYFCGVEVFAAIKFGDGVFVHVQSTTSNVKSIVQEQEEEKLWVGEPLDLSCMVESGSCSGEQQFFWLKHGTSQPAIYYPENDCSMENCAVTLKIKSVEPTDAGMYYCVLSACGEFLFGNGTSVEINASFHPLVNGLLLLLGIFFLTIIVLIIVVCRLRRNVSSSHRQEPAGQNRCCTPADTSDIDIYYAALNINRKTVEENQEDPMENACTYSSVRSRRE